MSLNFVKIIKIAMARKELNQKELAYLLAISEAELCRKFNGERAWANIELTALFEALELIIIPTRKFTSIIIKSIEEGNE